MEVEFRVDKSVPNCMELFKVLRSKAYRILVCYENKDKNGKSVKEHYHGYAEWNGNLADPESSVRNIIKKYATDKAQWMVRSMQNTTLRALAYCYKWQTPVIEYNICHDFDDIVNEWSLMKDEWVAKKKAKENYKDVMSLYVRDTLQSTAYVPLDDIKMLICKKMVSDKKLPVMGKVRSYTLYAILDNKIEIPECDLYKLC